MKYYAGATEDDRPTSGGKYVKENEYGNECYNFQDYNGSCYGFVKVNGSLNLKSYFQETDNNEFVEDVRVIWVSANSDNEARIVGWYKNAVVYSEEQIQDAFTNPEFDLFYRTEALAKDCYLLGEDQRTFVIASELQSNKDKDPGQSNVWSADSVSVQTNFINQVLDYIENYNGEFINVVIDDEMLDQMVKDSEVAGDYNILMQEGRKLAEQGDHLEALKFFNTARGLKETAEAMESLGDSLFILNRFDQAISAYEKFIEIQGESTEVLDNLISLHDFKGDRENTISCCKRLLKLYDDSQEGIEAKLGLYSLMFDIYVSLEDKVNAKAVMSKVSAVSGNSAKKCGKDMKGIFNDVFY
jgi:tetratricopeptide (TPR) repeat protein